MRRVTASLIAAGLLALSAVGPARATAPGPFAPPPERACAGAWEALLAPDGTIRGIATTPDGILAVGSIVRGQALQMVARLRPTGWELAAPPAGPGGTLAGISAVPGEAPWVAGSRIDAGSSAWIGRAEADPLGGRIVPAPSPVRAAPEDATVITAVAALPGDAAVAVGYRHGRTGQRAYIRTWRDGLTADRSILPEADGRVVRESVLVAVAADGPAGVWAAGWQGDGERIGPLLVRGDAAGDGWQAIPFPVPPGPETVLTALRPLGPDALLVAGYRVDGVRRSPFLVRRAADGTVTEIPLPVTGSGIVRAIAGSGMDDLVVAGATLPAAIDTVALLLERDGDRWHAPARPPTASRRAPASSAMTAGGSR
ncbi:MAG: hypothetical protein ACKOTZ_10660, partial [Chloroflexota bacterium]